MIKVKYTDSPTPDEVATLTNGLKEYNREHGMDALQQSMFYIEVDSKQVAGCLMKKAHNNLHIEHLWVDKRFRNQGYGTELMMLAEKYAKEQNCSFITANTMSWHAPDFYEKLGYSVEFERDGYPKNTALYMMRKDIQDVCDTDVDLTEITDDVLQKLDPIEETVLRVRYNINVEKCKTSLPNSAAEFMEIEAQALRKLPHILNNIPDS